MDATREMVEDWKDLQPSFPYSAKFISIEGFKIIGTELYRNVGLAILCVGVIVLITVASFRVSISSVSYDHSILLFLFLNSFFIIA
mmetsp:Transcript_532/g.1177  ORF Transcript_532/g.1177 Transcript_532/m.1177 type:complete len:86 (+) Transcript_532:1-258(+)